MRRSISIGLVGAIAGMIALSAACERRRPPRDTVVLLISDSIRSVDPRFALTAGDMKLSRLIAPGLLALDTPDMVPRLELAERIDRIDDVTWQVVLRPGLRFSDGTPLTAADVAWTYTSTFAKGSDSPFGKNLAERFKAVEAVDERTVRFRLVAPLATLMTDLDFGILSGRGADRAGHIPGGRVVGAGPFRLVSVGSRRLVLEANPHYHGGPPPSRRVDVRVVTDAAARILMLVGGSADLLQNAVRLDLVDDVVKYPHLRVESAPSVILTYLLMNNRDPVLADVRVRRAIALAIDRPAIIAHKLKGRAVPATGLIAPGSWAYEPDVPRWDHDLARAARLLDEAGLVDPDGPGPAPRLRLTFKTSTDQLRVAMARVLTAQLARVGIAVDVRSFETATFDADIKTGTYQLAIRQTNEIGEPDYYFTYFNSSRIPSPTLRDGTNRWWYRNARVDELTERGRRELDRGRRYAIYSEVQKIVAGDVPVVALWHEHNIVVRNRQVEGYRITPNAKLSGLVTAAKTPEGDR